VIVTVTSNTAIDRTLEVRNFKVGEVLSARLIAEQPAGKGVNVSRCLAALGVKSVATGFVGKAEEGLFQAALREIGVAPRFVAVSGSTRRDTTILDPVNQTETHIRERGFEVTRSDISRLRDTLARLCRRGDIVCFCGSLPPGMKPADAARMMKFLREKGARVALDASGSALSECAEVGGFLLKPNLHELSELTGKRFGKLESAARAAMPLLERFENVIISAGAEGAVLLNNGGAWHAMVNCADLKVANTVGCGDALLGGFLAGVVGRKPAEERLKLAVACGTASALTYSAGVFRIRDLKKFRRCVILRRLS